MFEVRSHLRGTEMPVTLAFGAGVLECFSGGASLGRFHVHGIRALVLDVDKRADFDLRIELANGAVHVVELPAEARPDTQLLVAHVERERAAFAA